MLTLDISKIVMTIIVVCLILWRISYGKDNGLFAEAAGIISVAAAFATIYYFSDAVMGLIKIDLGNVIPKIGYLIVAFLIYRIMTSIADALKKLKNVPVIGNVDRFFGAILGIVEAIFIIKLVEYITNVEILNTALSVCYELIVYIQKSFINK